MANPLYGDLALFIERELPYSTTTTIPNCSDPNILQLDDRNFPTRIDTNLYDDNHIVIRTGLHETDTAAHHPAFKPSSDFTLPERDKLIPWRFGGRDYTVTKAVRIWYNYGAENAAGQPIDAQGRVVGTPGAGPQRQVGTFLLIGYVGNGQP